MHTVYPVTTFSSTISYPSADYPVPTYTAGTQTQKDNGWAFLTSKAILHLPDWSSGLGRPGIIACHGYNQTAWSSLQPGSDAVWGDYHRFLADAGFVVLAADLGALHTGNNVALSVIDRAYTFLTAITGRTKVGLAGSSAGGLAVLNWYHQYPGRVGGAYLMNPYIDIDAVRATSGWAVPYSIQPGDPNADLYPGGGSPDKATSNGAYLCSDDAGFITNAVNQNRTPDRYPQDYADKNITVATALRDGGVPYQMSQWWVSAVNSPTVKLRLVTCATAQHQPYTLLGGGSTDPQTAAVGGLRRSELRDFFLAHL